MEKITISRKTKEEKKYYYCDLCKKEIGNPHPWCSSNEQGKIYYVDDYCSFPDNGIFEVYCFDLCNECIKNKVFPLIEKHLEIKPRYKEIDW